MADWVPTSLSRRSIRPRTTNRAEHVAAHDPGADIFHRAFGDVIVDAGGAARLADHFMKASTVCRIQAGISHP